MDRRRVAIVRDVTGEGRKAEAKREDLVDGLTQRRQDTLLRHIPIRRIRFVYVKSGTNMACGIFRVTSNISTNLHVAM